MVFDPATLAGKRLWLRAKDNTGVNGSAITTWADQSGGGHDGTVVGTAPTVATNSTTLGGKSVAFSADGGYFSMPMLPLSMVMSASSFYDNNYHPSLAADGILGNFWASTISTGWLQARPISLIIATSYTITSPQDLVSRAPRNWTFLGSNDATFATFTTLDTQSAITFTTTAQTFSFANSTAYAYYRLNITANNGQSNLGVAELQINSVSNTISTAAEMWVVLKYNGGNSGSWKMGSGVNNSGDESWYRYSNGNIYEDFGTIGGGRQSWVPSLPVESWRIYRVANDGTTWQAWLDGVSQLTASGKTVGWALLPTLGNNKAGGQFFGNMAEVLIRSQISTTQEVADITAYLTAEHFVAATAPPIAVRRPTMMSRVAVQRASRW